MRPGSRPVGLERLRIAGYLSIHSLITPLNVFNKMYVGLFSLKVQSCFFFPSSTSRVFFLVPVIWIRRASKPSKTKGSEDAFLEGGLFFLPK